MGILTDLLLDDAPAIAPGPTHDTPREERPTRSIGIDIPGAIEIADGLVRFLRSPAIPRSTVERLEWGADGVPPYVEQLDETYSVGGFRDRPSFTLVETRPRPPWIVFGDPAPAASLCCPHCGRRLFYVGAIDGEEYCLTCKPDFVPRVVPAEAAEVDVRPESIVFFLKPGVGLDW